MENADWSNKFEEILNSDNNNLTVHYYYHLTLDSRHEDIQRLHTSYELVACMCYEDLDR